MAPLLVGDLKNPNSSRSQKERRTFQEQVSAAVKGGATAISLDVWWGVPLEFYEPLFQAVVDAEGFLAPIISFHACGGGVGDTVSVPLPDEAWSKLPPYARFVSEYGLVSSEYIPYSATPLVLDVYKARMSAFMSRFARFRDRMVEINISLGRNGELGWPSYLSGDPLTDYPTRGALQCYGPLDIMSFRAFVEKRYGDRDNVLKHWGLPNYVEINPPSNVNEFFGRQDHLNTLYGRDLFDWYAGLPIDHGRLLMRAAMEVFGAEGSPFRGIGLGAKFPGVHWRVGGDRLAELTCGLIRTSDLANWNSDLGGHGYAPLISLFRELQNPINPVSLHFTCGEMGDGDGAPEVHSLAASLVRWVLEEAHRSETQRVPVKIENALACNLGSAAAWERMRGALKAGYEALTVLRMTDILASKDVFAEFKATTQLAQELSNQG